MCQADWCKPAVYAECDLCIMCEINEGHMPLLCIDCAREFDKIDHVAEFEKELDRPSWDV